MLGAGCAGGPFAPIVTEGPGLILDRDGAVLTEAALATRLNAAEIVVLGEIHDNPIHHARQARLVRALAPKGLAFEMVPADSEEGVQVYLAQGGAPDQIGPAIGWERMGWPDWPAYAQIFEAAIESYPDTYIAGGGVPRAKVRTALFAGAATAFGAGASDIGLTRPLEPALRIEVEDEMIASHCNALPREVATGMVEAQRLRDARFAEAALRAHRLGGGQTVLITGNGHARTDRGVPVYLGAVAPDLMVLSVGMLESAGADDPAKRPDATALPYDFVWLSRTISREDPCAAFRKG